MMKYWVVGLFLTMLTGSAEAASWQVDSAHSRLGFTGVQGGQPFEGHFTKYQATIEFDPANPAAGHAVVIIDMASAVTGDEDKDEALPQSQWFDIKDFPQARFEAATFQPKGGNAYEAIGTLTIRGIAHDVTLPFTLDITGDKAKAVGRLDIIRTQFGVGQGQWASGQSVGLEVGITLDLVAQKQP